MLVRACEHRTCSSMEGARAWPRLLGRGFQLERGGFAHAAGWEKPWVEQIVDRIMKNMLRTTEERTTAVVSGSARGMGRWRAGHAATHGLQH